MAGEDRAATTSLGDPLLRSGRDYSFFQFLRLLRLRFPDEQAFFDNLRIRAHLSLGFPHRDMESTHQSADGRYRIDANFFGLYGVTSPLPTFYTEDLIDEQLQGTSAGRDFIDILHAALYPLQFRAWQKHRIWSAISERPGGKSLHYLQALLGVAGASSGVRAQSIELLRYAGLFNQYPRSAAALQQLLRAVLDDSTVEVMPCVEGRVEIVSAARTYLGRQCGVLGEDCVIGRETLDRRGAVDIRIGPLTAERFNRLLPGSVLFRKLQQVVFLYLQSSLSVGLVLRLDAGERQGAVLGARRYRVGINACLGGKHAHQEVRFMLSSESGSRFEARNGS